MQKITLKGDQKDVFDKNYPIDRVSGDDDVKQNKTPASNNFLSTENQTANQTANRSAVSSSNGEISKTASKNQKVRFYYCSYIATYIATYVYSM